MKNVVSLALFRHSSSGYESVNAGESRGRYFTNCLPAAIRGYAACYPGWTVRIHHDDSIFNTYYGDVLTKLAAEGLLELVDCGKAETLCGAMLWRMKPAADRDVSRFICRDVDSMPSAREAAAVSAWVDSELAAHVIHDSPSHTGYMGGMMGFRADALRDIFGSDPYADAIKYAGDAGIELNTHGADQHVLNRLFKARLATSTFCSFDPEKLPHSEFRSAKPIPRRDLLNPRDRAVESIGTPFDRVGAVGVYNEASAADPEFAKIVALIVSVERSLFLDEQAYGPARPHRYVVTSSNLNHDYAFFVPIISAMWMRLGYRPIVFLIGSPEEWKTHRFGKLALAEARRRGALLHFAERVGGYPESTTAQTVRLAGAYTSLIREDDYLLTTDVDMLPLSRSFWGNPLDGHDFDVYFANAYEGEKRPHWPICYIGMTALSWIHLLGSYPDHNVATRSWMEGNLDRGAVARDPMVGWCFDEYFVSEKIAEAKKNGKSVRFIDRMKAPAGWPASRIDRGAWDETWAPNVMSTPDGLRIHPGAVDCHAPRPGYGEVAWQERVRPLLNAFEAGLGDSFNEYRDAFALA